MRQDQAAQPGHVQRKARFFAFHVGNAEERQRHARARFIFPMPFNGGDLRGLMLQCVQAMKVAHHGLQRRHQQQHAHRHGEHLLHGGAAVTAQQVPRARRAHHQRGRQERGDAHVRQAVRERRVEDHGEPVGGYDAPVQDLVAGGRLHPAVGRQDPRGRHQRAQRHHDGREKVQARAHARPAEQHHAQEAGFQEKGGQHFVGQQRPRHAAREVREKAPVGAELVRHHQAGHHAHAEVDGKDLGPEVVKVAIDGLARAQPEAFQHGQVAGQANRDGGKYDVK
ncbi:hypothetical protein D3C71_1276420 [compost metagenome]